MIELNIIGFNTPFPREESSIIPLQLLVVESEGMSSVFDLHSCDKDHARCNSRFKTSSQDGEVTKHGECKKGARKHL